MSLLVRVLMAAAITVDSVTRSKGDHYIVTDDEARDLAARGSLEPQLEYVAQEDADRVSALAGELFIPTTDDAPDTTGPADANLEH